MIRYMLIILALISSFLVFGALMEAGAKTGLGLGLNLGADSTVEVGPGGIVLCETCLTFDGTNALTFDGTNGLTF